MPPCVLTSSLPREVAIDAGHARGPAGGASARLHAVASAAAFHRAGLAARRLRRLGIAEQHARELGCDR